MSTASPASTASSSPPVSYSSRHLTLCMALLWLAGCGLRLTILAPPPVIGMVRDDLGMTATQIGLLSGIPAALFALAAIPGALLIARLGARNALIIGLLSTAVGSALRGAVPDVALLYAATVLTGFGVAVMQPAMPTLVRTWLPRHIGVATAVYTNGLLIGEVLPVALTLSVVLPLVGGWRADFVVWGVACALIAAIIYALSPRPAAPPASAAPAKWWPDWRNALIWKLGLMMGCVNAVYFTTNFFLPRYLQVLGREGDVSAALIALNVGQLPASVLLLFLGGAGLQVRSWPYIGAGLLCALAVLGMAFGNSLTAILGAGVIGFTAAAVLILMLSLPPILSPAEDVHRSTAAMFAISYTCAVIVPVVSGMAWDMSGIAALSFLPTGLCTVVLMVTAALTKIRPFGESDESDTA